MKKCLHFLSGCANILKHSYVYAPLAQLDRASGYGPEGQEFESLTACQTAPKSADFGAVFAFLGTFCGVLILADPYRDPYGNGEGKGSESSGEKGTYLFYASKFYISVLR